MNNKKFKKKLIYYVITFLLLTFISLKFNTIDYTFIIVVFVLFCALIFRNYKEISNPSFFEDERNVNIAYRAESIAFRFTALCVIIIFLGGNTLLKEFSPKNIASSLLFIMLITKILSYKILQRKY